MICPECGNEIRPFYNQIREIYFAEKEEGLSKIPNNFFKNFNIWYKANKEDKSTIALLETENALKLISDIKNRRLKKIVIAVLQNIRGQDVDTKNLTNSESIFFTKLSTFLTGYNIEGE